MNTTPQMYVGGASYTNFIQPTASLAFDASFNADDQRPASPASGLTTEEFITRNGDLIGLAPDLLAPRLTERLQATPVHHRTTLDDIALLRTFTPNARHSVASHYALLYKGFSLVGLVWLSAQDNNQSMFGDGNEPRLLMKHILAVDAEKVTLATTRTYEGDAYVTPFSNRDLDLFDKVYDAFNCFDVEVIDYLLLFPNQNSSYILERYGVEDGLDDGVTDDDLVFHYVDQASPATA